MGKIVVVRFFFLSGIYTVLIHYIPPYIYIINLEKQFKDISIQFHL